MVENTSRRAPIEHLAGALIEGVDGYITGMESTGQQQLVNSDVLPAHGNWDQLTELGIVRGESVQGDDLFVHATLPDGWKKKREDGEDARGSYLVDERGVARASIFYKAAFYDRQADINVINVGYHLSTKAIYGDAPAALPSAWDVLTETEKCDFRESLDNYLADAERCPQVYGDRAERVRALIMMVHQP